MTRNRSKMPSIIDSLDVRLEMKNKRKRLKGMNSIWHYSLPILFSGATLLVTFSSIPLDPVDIGFIVFFFTFTAVSFIILRHQLKFNSFILLKSAITYDQIISKLNNKDRWKLRSYNEDYYEYEINYSGWVEGGAYRVTLFKSKNEIYINVIDLVGSLGLNRITRKVKNEILDCIKELKEDLVFNSS